MNRELPEINIGGTDFLVDVKLLQLREKTNPENTISIFDMRETDPGYSFVYSISEKNIPGFKDREWSDIISVALPELVVLDPVGMSLKYNVPVETLRKMTDFDLMVDQKAFDMRVNKGMLPTVDIAGHIFYVDLRMDMLRPKDDFLSKGIVLGDIDRYYYEEVKAYIIPYNPKKREFQEPEYEKLTSLPKDLIVVRFPHMAELDPVGWNRLLELGEKDGLKEFGLKSHFAAKKVPWAKTNLPVIIKENLEKEQRLSANLIIKQTKAPKEDRKRGRSV